MSRVQQLGFRLPDPVSTADGRWVQDGWSASRFMPGLRPAAPAWRDITEAGLRFADAAEQAREDGQDVLSGRTHRWAVADRVAWRGKSRDNSRGTGGAGSDLGVVGAPSAEKHFVHGDLSGNVFLDPSGVHVILDVSPYLLSARQWAAAIVTADAVLWGGASTDLAASHAEREQDRDLLCRALIFRLVAEQLADHPRHGALLKPYRHPCGSTHRTQARPFRRDRARPGRVSGTSWPFARTQRRTTFTAR